MLNHTKHAGVGAARERVSNFSAPERDTAPFPAQLPRWGGWDSGRRLRLVGSIGESLFLRYFMRVPMPFRKCYPHDLILSQKPHPTTTILDENFWEDPNTGSTATVAFCPLTRRRGDGYLFPRHPSPCSGAWWGQVPRSYPLILHCNLSAPVRNKEAS